MGNWLLKLHAQRKVFRGKKTSKQMSYLDLGYHHPKHQAASWAWHIPAFSYTRARIHRNSSQRLVAKLMIPNVSKNVHTESVILDNSNCFKYLVSKTKDCYSLVGIQKHFLLISALKMSLAFRRQEKASTEMSLVLVLREKLENRKQLYRQSMRGSTTASSATITNKSN